MVLIVNFEYILLVEIIVISCRIIGLDGNAIDFWLGSPWLLKNCLCYLSTDFTKFKMTISSTDIIEKGQCIYLP